VKVRTENFDRGMFNPLATVFEEIQAPNLKDIEEYPSHPSQRATNFFDD